MSKQTNRHVKKALAASLLAIPILALSAGITFAEINDDTYEGNIFSLYGNNGALVPPRLSLADSIRRKQPALVILYVNDSRDCKKQAPEITVLQSRFGQLVNFIAVNADTMPGEYPELQPYFRPEVPRILLFDPQGRLIYEANGYTPAKVIEPQLRALVAKLPPESRKPSLMAPVPGT